MKRLVKTREYYSFAYCDPMNSSADDRPSLFIRMKKSSAGNILSNLSCISNKSQSYVLKVCLYEGRQIESMQKNVNEFVLNATLNRSSNSDIFLYI